MRVLLGVPPRPRRQVLQILPPLGLGWLTAFLRAAGHEVRLVDLLVANGREEHWVEALRSHRPDLVGIGAFTSDLPVVDRMLNLSRRERPDAVTVLGGPHASGDPAATLDRLPALDLAFRGEGERAIVAIADAVAGDRAPHPDAIPGLAVRAGAGIHASEPAFEADLDALGTPAWDAIDPRAYQAYPPTLFVRRRPFAPIIVTRGCPYRCTFCAGHRVTGRTMRSRTVEHVREEILHLHDAYGIREIHIEDDHFTWDRGFVLRFSEALRTRGPDVTWTMPNGIRIETLDRELLREMRSGGCYALILGIESGSARILRHMRKALTPSFIREKVALARSEGFHVHGFFMLGYPEETLEDVQATERFALDLDLSGANFHSFRPLPGTLMGSELLRRGELRSWDVAPDAVSFASPVYAPASIPPRRLKALQRRMLVRFYLRPRILLATLREAMASRALVPLARKAVTYLA